MSFLSSEGFPNKANSRVQEIIRYVRDDVSWRYLEVTSLQKKLLIYRSFPPGTLIFLLGTK